MRLTPLFFLVLSLSSVNTFAVGFRQHGDLDELYPIPPELELDG